MNHFVIMLAYVVCLMSFWDMKSGEVQSPLAIHIANFHVDVWYKPHSESM